MLRLSRIAHQHLTRFAHRRWIGSSAKYWEWRYAQGGNSGAGSSDHLAAFKANFLNDFVDSHEVTTVIELGCGDGRQLLLSRYPSYLGIDVSDVAIGICRELFRNDGTKRFLKDVPDEEVFDLAISLDVIYHLIEDDVFNAYMTRLFSKSRRWVIIYSSNMSQFEFEARYGKGAPHVRHRRFTDWIAAKTPQWALASQTRNQFTFDPNNPTGTSFADFYVYERS